MNIHCYLILASVMLSPTHGVSQQVNKIDAVNQLIKTGKYQKGIDFVDSLFATSNFQKNSKRKNQLLVKKADCYYYLHNLESAFEYYLLAAKNEELLLENDKAFISDAFGNAAYCLVDLGLNEQAIKYSKLSYNYAQDSGQMAVTTSNIGVSYKHLGDYTAALTHFEEAYAIDKNLQDSIGIAYDLNNLGFLFKEWEKYDQALVYFKESMAIVKKANLKKEMATRFSNMAQVYLAMNDLREAERNIAKAIAIDKEIEDQFGLAKHFNLLGQISESKKDYQQAIDYQLQALALHQKLKTRSTLAITHRLLAQNYFKLNQINDALTRLDEGIEIARANHYTNELMNLFKLKAKYLSSINKNQEARLYEDSYRVLKDSMYSIENSNKIYQMELATELAKKEEEIKGHKQLADATLQKLKAKNTQLIIWLTIGFLLVAFLSLYLFKSKQLKNNKQYQLEIADLQGKLQALIKNDPESFNIKIKDINNQLDEPLSEKEFDVVKFIFTKKSNVEIGEELELSVNTVKFHFKNIYKKFGVKNRKEALQYLLVPA
jgi:ATP/maltotriose-dependent transcriptional regulator MalT